ANFEAFQRVLIEAHQRHPIRILSDCVWSNHWHFAVWPEADGQVTAFFRWWAHTHAMRWRVAHRTVGSGPLSGRIPELPGAERRSSVDRLAVHRAEPCGRRTGRAGRAVAWEWLGGADTGSGCDPGHPGALAGGPARGWDRSGECAAERPGTG